MNKIITRIVVLCALTSFAAFDFVSTLSTCQQIEQEKAEQRSEKSCGIVQSLTYRAIVATVDWIDGHHDFVTAGATVVIAVFTIALWRATDRLWSAGERQLEMIRQNAVEQSADMKASIEAARAANEISRRALIADQRAWLAVSDLQIDNDVVVGFLGGVTFHVSVKITNFGKTPAMAVHTNMDIITEFKGSAEAVNRLAAKYKTEETYWNRILFPNDSYRRKWGLSVDPTKCSAPTIIGCVTYRILEDALVHQTGFAFHLFECRPGTNEFVGSIRASKEPIPRERIGNSATPGWFAN